MARARAGLPLDHISFTTGGLSRLQRGFEALGFTVSPQGAYTSADFPDARWLNRAVFLREGWFDLLENSAIDAAAKAFADVRTEAPYRLVRRWDDEQGLPPETFRLFSIRERIAPVGLAVIEHAWPCPDIAPAWMAHANGALALDGLTFGGAEPGPAAGECAGRLDLSGFEYLDAEAFAARYGSSRRPVAVRIRVRSLNHARMALEIRGTAYQQEADILHVPPRGAIGWGFSFFQ